MTDLLSSPCTSFTGASIRTCTSRREVTRLEKQMGPQFCLIVCLFLVLEPICFPSKSRACLSLLSPNALHQRKLLALLTTSSLRPTPAPAPHRSIQSAGSCSRQSWVRPSPTHRKAASCCCCYWSLTELCFAAAIGGGRRPFA